MSDNQKLAPSEIEKLKSFIQKYQKFWNEVNEIDEEIKKLDEVKTESLTKVQEISVEIEKVRQEEADFQATLVAKYGPFHLNVETFEIKLHNN
jgi:uncharacterized protein YdcH (DUF465 family)